MKNARCQGLKALVLILISMMMNFQNWKRKYASSDKVDVFVILESDAQWTETQSVWGLQLKYFRDFLDQIIGSQIIASLRIKSMY